MREEATGGGLCSCPVQEVPVKAGDDSPTVQALAPEESLPRSRREGAGTREDICEAEARGLLWEGCLGEREGDFGAALDAYLSGLQLCKGAVWEVTSYFLHHNAARTLNRLSRFAEAERLSRTAVGIAPWLPDAYVSLAVGLEGQGRYAEAAMAYLRATAVSPREHRAFDMLLRMVRDHPEVPSEHDCIGVGLEECLALTGRHFNGR